VLAARTSVIEEHPEDLKALIKGMLKAQLMFEQQREQILGELVGTYYKTSLENARIGAQKQPPCVDQRAQTDFILGRVDTILEMGYIKKKPGGDAIDWMLLEAAIKEVPEVYSQLKYKSA
jgi:NitT/TauT family transport system substrate-binding protein